MWRSHVIPNECEESAEKTATKSPTSFPKTAKCGKTPFGQQALYLVVIYLIFQRAIRAVFCRNVACCRKVFLLFDKSVNKIFDNSIGCDTIQ
jgi:hypothetical protein